MCNIAVIKVIFQCNVKVRSYVDDILNVCKMINAIFTMQKKPELEQVSLTLYNKVQLSNIN